MKELSFPKILSSSQFQSDWVLNQPWVLEFNIIREGGPELYRIQNAVATNHGLLFNWMHNAQCSYIFKKKKKKKSKTFNN